MQTEPIEPEPPGTHIGIYVLCAIIVLAFILIASGSFFPGTRGWIRDVIRAI